MGGRGQLRPPSAGGLTSSLGCHLHPHPCLNGAGSQALSCASLPTSPPPPLLCAQNHGLKDT
eukprot:2797051-Rhodomonas_salina.1